MNEFNIDELLKKINELQAELKSARKYGLVWDKEHTVEINAQTLILNIPIITNNESKNVYSGKDASEIIAIKGDNYHSLVALSYVMRDSVDLIYIDPPYNTGIKDFIYNDRYINLEDSYYHSSWLNFMEKRLKIARDLLSENGVIFISIDNHEAFQLKLLCDSIFDESNFLSCLIHYKNNSQNDASNFQENHEYCFCYTKKRKYEIVNGKKKEISLVCGYAYDSIELSKDKNGYYYVGREIHKTGANSRLIERKYLGYTIYWNSSTGDIIAKMDYNPDEINENSGNEIYHTDTELVNKGYLPVRPPMQDGGLGRWTWSMDNVNSNKETIICVKNREGGFFFKKKIYVDPSKVVLEGKKAVFKQKKKTNLRSTMNYNTSEGTEQLKLIFGQKIFDNPKNVNMIKYLIRSLDKKDPVILDFFAGSGTTGQAVLELNSEDKQNRRLILCNNDENGIFTNILYPRIKTVATGIRPDKKQYQGICSPANIYWMETDFITNQKNTEQTKYVLVERLDSLLCLSEDIFGKVYRNDFSAHYSNGKRHLFIYNDYYNKNKFASFKKEIEGASGEKVVYIYSSDNEIDTNLISGKDVVLKPIPSKIYEIYKEIVEGIKRGE